MSDPFFVCETIGVGSPYMTRVFLGRLRLHIFHRGDGDPDPHDHPWPFWTFPLTSYVEEISTRDPYPVQDKTTLGGTRDEVRVLTRWRVVRAFRFHFRAATHCHRVLGRWNGRMPIHPQQRPEDCMLQPGKIVTFVWRGSGERAWGFLKQRGGRVCWTPWREYVFQGGKDAPCRPSKET